VKKVSFAEMDCSIAQALEIIGEWWTLLILRDAFLGVTRFEHFASNLGISRNVLTARLDTLVEHDVLTRVPYDEARGRYDYRLTSKGRALLPVITAIRQWGDEWIFGAGNEPIVVAHTICGQVTKATLTCDHCHEELRARDLEVRRRPGRARGEGSAAVAVD
jgi:DNA-binding HxlR family transcriptional regulator